MTQPIQKTFSWAPVVDTVALVSTAFAATQTPAFTWLTSPISPSGIAVTSAVNAFSLLIFNAKDRPLKVTAALIAGGVLTTLLAKPLAAYSIIVSTQAILEVTAFNLLTKVMLTACTYLGTTFFETRLTQSSITPPKENVSPQNAPRKELNPTNLSIEEIASLKEDDVSAYHTYCINHDPSLSTEQYEAFAQRFFEFSLGSPGFKYTTKFSLPKSLTPVQSQYCFNYFAKHPDKFYALSDEEKELFKKIFKHGKNNPEYFDIKKRESIKAWVATGLKAFAVFAIFAGCYRTFYNHPIDSDIKPSKPNTPNPSPIFTYTPPQSGTTSPFAPTPTQTQTSSDSNPLYAMGISFAALGAGGVGITYCLNQESQLPLLDINAIKNIKIPNQTEFKSLPESSKQYKLISQPGFYNIPETAQKFLFYLFVILTNHILESDTHFADKHEALFEDIHDTKKKNLILKIEDLKYTLTIEMLDGTKHQAIISFESLEKLNRYEYDDFKLNTIPSNSNQIINTEPHNAEALDG